MKLGAVLSSINTFLRNTVAGIEIHVGAEWVDKAKSPPAVVWVPGRERFERPSESHRAKPNEQARSLGTNIATVYARCWAKRSSTGPAAHEYDVDPACGSHDFPFVRVQCPADTADCIK